MTRSAAITAIGRAFPPASQQSDLWDGFFRDHYRDSAVARRLFTSVGIERRHAVANPLVEDVSTWSTEARMARYVPEAVPLARLAVEQALDAGGVDAADIGLFAVASCTGYATPGIDTVVAGDVGMTPSVRRMTIGHMGCYAALPGLGAVSDFVALHQRPAVLLCVELTSLHIQPSTTDVEQMVAHALFSDAAAAAVVVPGSSSGLEVVDVVAHTDVSQADLMTWNVTDAGFRMGLSQRVPEALARQVRPAVEELLNRHDLSVDDVDAWAVHPGGPRILEVIGEELKLDDADLAASRRVLNDHGNCSSPTILMVLDEISRSGGAPPGSNIAALAFGPGLTLYAVLLRT